VLNIVHVNLERLV